jgi:hypothetical protein
MFPQPSIWQKTFDRVFALLVLVICFPTVVLALFLNAFVSPRSLLGNVMQKSGVSSLPRFWCVARGEITLQEMLNVLKK